MSDTLIAVYMFAGIFILAVICVWAMRKFL